MIRVAFVIGDYPPDQFTLRADAAAAYASADVEVGILKVPARPFDGLTPAEVRWQPTPHTNHIAWLVWHLARVEDGWVSRLRRAPAVWQADGWAARFHMDPVSSGAGQTIEEVRAMPERPLTDLMAYFDAVRARHPPLPSAGHSSGPGAGIRPPTPWPTHRRLDHRA